MLCAKQLRPSVASDSLRSHGIQPTRLFFPWGFFRQEYWSGLPWPPPGDLPNPGIETSLHHPSKSNLAWNYWSLSEMKQTGAKRVVINGPRKGIQNLGWGRQGVWLSSYWLVVRKQGSALGILCSAWNYHPPPGWGSSPAKVLKDSYSILTFNCNILLNSQSRCHY